MRRLAFLIAAAVFVSSLAHAGGPKYVAGSSYFDPAMKGTPLTWAQGSINYYTDQGDLSAILLGPDADSFVANAFSRWTSISTAAVSAVHAGQLAEDVSGANVSMSNGVLTMPADIQPGATATPVGVVYDADGAVTDALLGAGASNVVYCGADSVFGGIDNFGTNAQFLHALIIMNGNCAASSSQLPDLQYHLVRVIGRVLGLDWSQANLNVITHKPPPTAADYYGFPVMHESDPPACVPIGNCYSDNGLVDPSQPKMDDQAALSRLYPVTAQNISNFPGKQILGLQTARIHGSVYFSDAFGMPTQPMQGVNVVARWIDPGTGLPSGAYAASSISGFLFTGNAGNMISGYTDATGQNFDRWGSDDPTLEGSFDLAGLQIPTGSAAQYQLTVEAVDSTWSSYAGPYGSTLQVKPSGSSAPIVVTVNAGSDTLVNVVMQRSAIAGQSWYAPTTYVAPAQVPPAGNWGGTLSGYGAADFFQFSAQANRTLSVIVNAVDEFGVLSESKAMPVIGMWAISNPGQSPAPANTPSAFNTSFFAESRLDAQVLQNSAFRLGITDYRGDGRPDYRYKARLLYGDTLNPSRASVAGGTALAIRGLGLQSDTIVQAAGTTEPVLASSPTQLLINSPAVADGVSDLQLSDTKTGGSSVMSGVLTIGAGPGDLLKLISGTNPATPVGGQAPMPFTLRVVAADGVTPVAGASVQFASSPAVAFSACSGASSCRVLSDQSGIASTFMTVLSSGVTNLTATLAPASYPNPQQVNASLLGISSQVGLSLQPASVWIAQGANVNLPLTARVLSNGVPVSGATVNFQITQGSASLSAGSAQTDPHGYAVSNLQMKAASASVQVSVCAANACQSFNATVVPAASLRIQPVGGTLQRQARIFSQCRFA